jgi:hypothetical protein
MVANDEGFEIKGTTVHNVSLCTQKAIRKVGEQIGSISSVRSESGALKFFKSVSGKETDTTTRSNEFLVLLKAFA